MCEAVLKRVNQPKPKINPEHPRSGVGILDGDLLAVHRAAEARSGQIVVTRQEDEVTVKRLQRRGSRVELIAENPDYAPIVVNGPLTIEGLVVGLIRGGRAL